MAPFDGSEIRFLDATVVPEIAPDGAYRFRVERPRRPPLSFPVDGVIGGGHMAGGGTQGFLTAFPDGTLRFLPFDWSADLGRWFCNALGLEGWWTAGDRRVGGDGWVPIDPGVRLTDCGDWPPFRVMGATTEFANCQQCHGSGISVERQGPARFSSSVRTYAVDCESCHGPAAEHVALARAGNLSTRVDIGLPALSLLDEDSSLQVCFQCHALKRQLSAEDQPHRPFQERFSLLLPLVQDGPLGPDGRVRGFAYQQNHRASVCYLAGSMTCVDCHDPHSQGYRDVTGASLRGRLDDGQCTGCHQSLRDQGAAHSGHPPGSDGARCVSCHMPYVQHPVVGDRVPYARADHTVPIPRPDDPLEGPPNACSLCHADRDRGAVANDIERLWGEVRPRRSLVEGLLRGEEPERVLAEAGSVGPGAWDPALGMALGRLLERASSGTTPSPETLERLRGWAVSSDPDIAALALTALRLGGGAADLRFPDRELAILRRLGDGALDGGDAETARALYGNALQVSPGDARLLADVAAAHAAEGSPDAALASYDEALAADPGMAPVWVNRGVTLEELGRTQEAVESYLAALDVNPRDGLAHFNLGTVLFRQGAYEPALEEFLAAVDSDPGLADAHLLAAQTFLLLGRPDSALVYVSSAVDLDPDSDPARRMLADLLSAGG